MSSDFDARPQTAASLDDSGMFQLQSTCQDLPANDQAACVHLCSRLLGYRGMPDWEAMDRHCRLRWALPCGVLESDTGHQRKHKTIVPGSTMSRPALSWQSPLQLESAEGHALVVALCDASDNGPGHLSRCATIA